MSDRSQSPAAAAATTTTSHRSSSRRDKDHRDKGSSGGRHRDRDKEKDKDKDKDRERRRHRRSRSRSRSKSRDRERHRHHHRRDRDKDKDKDRDRGDREKDRSSKTTTTTADVPVTETVVEVPVSVVVDSKITTDMDVEEVVEPSPVAVVAMDAGDEEEAPRAMHSEDPVTNGPNQESIKTVMESLSVEERTRQRRERVERWRREKFAREAAERVALGLPPDPESETVVVDGGVLEDVEGLNGEGGSGVDGMVVDEELDGVGKKGERRKGWSLDDDEEEEEGAIVETPVATTTDTFVPPPNLRPLSQKDDDAPTIINIRPQEAKPIVFGGTSARPTTTGTTKTATMVVKPKAPVIFAAKRSATPFASRFGVAAPVVRKAVFDGDEDGDASATTDANATTTNTTTTATNQPRVKRKLAAPEVIFAEANAAAATAAAAVEKDPRATNGMDVDDENEDVASRAPRTTGDDEEDALEAFMVDVESEVKKLHDSDLKAMQESRTASSRSLANVMEAEEVVGDVRPLGEDDDNTPDNDDDEDIMAAAQKSLASRRKDLAVIDHSTVKYQSFQKDFYVESRELAALTDAEVDIRRAALGGVKIKGVDCPRPVERWSQMGLPPAVSEVIKKVFQYERPTSIQAQAIPAIMKGRDVIGIAKTGSGKTVAFLLPMFRHIKAQPPLSITDGPIALIMTPTRELAVQIHKECKPFARALSLRSVCCYGGSPIKDQIAELKRGAEIIICTPGRMIDLLCANSGRVTNLKRVTYLVLDEADRMFDMGFEPQVMRMVGNCRPDRQTILFSATFPRKMEALARRILIKPLEITIGGRSVVATDVTQIVEVVESENKFLRLLEILGLLFDRDADSKCLVFVEKQDAADNLLRDLLKRGYPCQTLHGGKDQHDRESTIADFKSGVVNVVIATSVAARGLDVKNLSVVVNYDVPNHMEDYVHRCGRTGRAGNKGTAYTFIQPDQDRYTVDIVQALKMSERDVPADVQALADSFIAKVKEGRANYSGSGFGGKGLDRLEKERDVVKRIQKRTHGGEDEAADADEEVVEGMFEDGDNMVGDEGEGGVDDPTGLEFNVRNVKSAATTAAALAADKQREEAIKQAAANVAKALGEAASSVGGGGAANIKNFKDAIDKVNAQVGLEGLSKARSLVAQFNQKYKGIAKKDGGDSPFAYEFEINDFPQRARWKVTMKETITQIIEVSGAAITTRGSFFPQGKQPGPNERKLFLFIEGETQMSIDIAKREIKRVLKEETMMAIESGTMNQGARYLVTNG